MTDPQALELARRIASCWRGGSPLAEWVAELARLDQQPATHAFERLRRTLEHPPSIPRFLAEYRALTATNVVALPEPAERRMSRDQALAVMQAAGAPRHMLSKKPGGPL